MRVQNREPGGDQGLRQVEEDAVAAHAQVFQKRLTAVKPHVFSLGGQRQHGVAGGEEHEGRLFHESAAIDAPSPIAVDQQQDQRQAHGHRLGEVGEQGRRKSDAEPRTSPLPVRSASVDDKRREKEDGAEEILLRGNPGHRLDVEGMQAEQERCDGGGPQPDPERAGENEHQDRHRQMQGEAHGVVRQGIQSEQTVLNSERQQREGVIAAHLDGGEEAADTLS
jgi:hypothetical protein